MLSADVELTIDLVDGSTTNDARRDADQVPRSPGRVMDDEVLSSRELEIWSAHVGYRQTRSPHLLEGLVTEYRRYAISLARRFHRDGEPLDDLIQVACEALVLAIQRFDPDRGVRFPAYATPTIVGALKRHYRDLGWSVRVPRRVHELARPAREAADTLGAQLGRPATVAEVAAALDVSEDTLVYALEAVSSRSTRSLSSTTSDEGDPELPLGFIDARLAKAEERMVLADAFRTLSPDERELVELYYFRDLSQSAIGARIGVSQMQVSRLLAGIVAKLRGAMVAA